MIAKTEAIPLRISPYSRTSHMVTWLTRDYGRVTTAIKGALRPKSPFLGQYDLGYTCELLFYERERDGVHVARECCPLCIRSSLRMDWRAFSCAAYLSDLVRAVTFPSREAPDGLFPVFEAVLDALSRQHRDPLMLLAWFELQLLQSMGYAPRLDRCRSCGNGLGSSTALFDPAHGAARCPRCQAVDRATENALVAIGRDTQALLRQWRGEASMDLLRNTVLSRNQQLALLGLTGSMLLYCFDVRPESRDVAVRGLRYGEEMRDVG